MRAMCLKLGFASILYELILIEASKCELIRCSLQLDLAEGGLVCYEGHIIMKL